MTESNVGKWNRWYASLTEPQAYGDTITYEWGAKFLEDCPLVEDWGCGKGWMRRFIPEDRYVGLDGSHSPFADKIVDLATYRSSVPGVFMRHVLEHNYQWAAILENAVASAQSKFFLVLFTPTAETTREIAYAEDPGVPDISFRLEDIIEPIVASGMELESETIHTSTQYGVETVFRCTRN
jgi:hypothetical protein